MKYRNDYYLFLFNKINNFVREPLNEVFSCSPVFNWMGFRISIDEVDSCINLQKEIK